jgi:hypothetical protein
VLNTIIIHKINFISITRQNNIFSPFALHCKIHDLNKKLLLEIKNNEIIIHDSTNFKGSLSENIITIEISNVFKMIIDLKANKNQMFNDNDIFKIDEFEYVLGENIYRLDRGVLKINTNSISGGACKDMVTGLEIEESGNFMIGSNFPRTEPDLVNNNQHFYTIKSSLKNSYTLLQI